MAYRYDPDLEFLGTCSSAELNDLANLITHDKDNSSRWTETLTTNERYKRYYPEHAQYWREIAEEIQLFGGNTFANLFRLGEGVLYKEILCDVCDKMKVNYNKKSSTQYIENNLLMKILEQTLDKMSPEELKEFSLTFDLENINEITPQALTTAFIAIFRAGGFRSYQLTLIIVNAISRALIGKGLTFATNASLTKAAALISGPIGWTVTALWTAIDISGTAYRVTIPAVIQIAFLRKLVENRKAIEQEKFKLEHMMKS